MRKTSFFSYGRSSMLHLENRDPSCVISSVIEFLVEVDHDDLQSRHDFSSAQQCSGTLELRSLRRQGLLRPSGA